MVEQPRGAVPGAAGAVVAGGVASVDGEAHDDRSWAVLAIGAERAAAVSKVVSRLVPPATRLTPAQLAAVTSTVARERSLWTDVVVHDPVSRWYTVLHRSQELDVWLLSWTPEQDTDWHDHGGSGGSFAVADGRLEERYRRGSTGRTARRVLGAGQVAAFGPAHVHNVSHDGAMASTSIHAYSPPLAAMTYYDLTPRGLFARAPPSPCKGPRVYAVAARRSLPAGRSARSTSSPRRSPGAGSTTSWPRRAAG